jgi:hypothetical protein
MEGEILNSETRRARTDDAGQFHYKNLRSQVAQGGSGAGEARGRRVFAPGRVDALERGGFRENGENASVWRQYRGLDGGWRSGGLM